MVQFSLLARYWSPWVLVGGGEADRWSCIVVRSGRISMGCDEKWNNEDKRLSVAVNTV